MGNLHLNLHLIEMLRLALTMLVASVAADDADKDDKKTKCETAADCKDAGDDNNCLEYTWEAKDADGVVEATQKEWKENIAKASFCTTEDKCKEGAKKAKENSEGDYADVAKESGFKSAECVKFEEEGGSAAVPIIIVIVVLGAIGAVVGLKMKKKACFADKANEGGYRESMI